MGGAVREMGTAGRQVGAGTQTVRENQSFQQPFVKARPPPTRMDAAEAWLGFRLSSERAYSEFLCGPF